MVYSAAVYGGITCARTCTLARTTFKGQRVGQRRKLRAGACLRCRASAVCRASHCPADRTPPTSVLSATRTRGTHASFGMRISHVRGPSAMSVGSWPSTSDAEVPHAIFTVKVHAQMLKAPEALPVASNRHSVRVARAVHAYNLFIKIEVKRLRTLDAR